MLNTYAVSIFWRRTFTEYSSTKIEERLSLDHVKAVSNEEAFGKVYNYRITKDLKGFDMIYKVDILIPDEKPENSIS